MGLIVFSIYSWAAWITSSKSLRKGFKVYETLSLGTNALMI